MFKANKEDTKTIIKYFPKLIIKASFIRPKGTFLWTIVPLKQINLSWRWTYVVMQFFSNSFENSQDCWLMVSNNFSVFPLFIVAIISNKNSFKFFTGKIYYYNSQTKFSVLNFHELQSKENTI